MSCGHFHDNVHCGPDPGAPDSDPNPRLQSILDAARRGAKVRILLDAFLDSEGEDAETVAHLRQVALAEQLDLQARLANPTSLGLHNKMVLARIGGRGYVHAGSINGSETSSKVNRELALQVQSDAYSYLLQPFASALSTLGRHRRLQRRLPRLALSHSRRITLTPRTPSLRWR